MKKKKYDNLTAREQLHEVTHKALLKILDTIHKAAIEMEEVERRHALSSPPDKKWKKKKETSLLTDEQLRHAYER